jgi:hypothetical protein
MSMPPDCNDLELRIRRLIADGATRYRRDKTYASIHRLVVEFARECSAAHADYFGVALDLTFAKDTVPNLQRRLEILSSLPETPPRTQVAALNLLAKLGFSAMPQIENYAMRERALSIARANRLATEEIVTLTNWVLAHHYRQEYAQAEGRLLDAEKVLASLPKDLIQSDPALTEAVARLFGHKGKALFVTALTGTSAYPLASIDQGNRLYERAIEAIVDNDHHRINLQTEWAEELQELGAAGWSAVLPLATSALDESAYVMQTYLTLCERAGVAYPLDAFANQAGAILLSLSNAKGSWVGTTLPARTAATVQRLADANFPLRADHARALLKVLDALIDLGDRRSAALEQAEAFRSVQMP